MYLSFMFFSVELCCMPPLEDGKSQDLIVQVSSLVGHHRGFIVGWLSFLGPKMFSSNPNPWL